MQQPLIKCLWLTACSSRSILSFRSKRAFVLSSIRLLAAVPAPAANASPTSSIRRMSTTTHTGTTVSIEELKSKSQQASELIGKLKQQIEQIKVQTSPQHAAQKAAELQSENEQLRKRIDELKLELEQTEAARGSQKPSEIKSDTKKQQPAAVVAQPKAEPAAPAAKKEKQQQQQPAKEQQQQKKKQEEILPQDVDVSKLDIRVGKILKCSKHPDADSLYVEEIDLGEAKPRNVCSGLVKHIPIEQMQNRMCIVLCNLKPSKLRGAPSEAMVLCASTAEKVELMEPPQGAQVGDRVTAAEGYEGEPAAECNPKNNIFGLVAVDLKTDDALNGTYKGTQLVVKGKGPIRSSTLVNVPIK